MSDTQQMNATEFTLPSSVVRRVDIARLVDEAERVDNDMTTAAVREKAGVDTEARAGMSQQLTDFLAANQLEFADSNQRSQLIAQLRRLKHDAPSVHMTFATEADQDSLTTLVEWLRASVHPQTVITVGLQPGLVGGVYVRTTNHVHDLSVRAQLVDGRSLIIEELEALGGGR